MINRKGFREAGCCRGGEKEKKDEPQNTESSEENVEKKKISVNASRHSWFCVTASLSVI